MLPRTWGLLLVLAVCASLQDLVSAQPKPGSVFPFFDNCRRQRGNQLRNITFVSRKSLSGGVTEYCVRINVLKTKCTQEIFYQGSRRIESRCCDTTFAKIKFYANVNCRGQYLPSPVTVPLQPSLSKVVSPTWEYTSSSQLNYTAVKYTQFGPIPQDKVDGTTFCLRLAAPTGRDGSRCATDNWANIANPAVGKKGLFQISIYDRKTDNYECCPTFTFFGTRQVN